MKAADYENLADLLLRVIERHKATAEPNAVVLMILSMLEQEYRAAPQIMPVDPP